MSQPHGVVNIGRRNKVGDRQSNDRVGLEEKDLLKTGRNDCVRSREDRNEHLYANLLGDWWRPFDVITGRRRFV